jgi:hypothetical protein
VTNIEAAHLLVDVMLDIMIMINANVLFVESHVKLVMMNGIVMNVLKIENTLQNVDVQLVLMIVE